MAYNESSLRLLISQYSCSDLFQMEKLPQSGSSRIYFRITFEDTSTLIGVYNTDVKENIAFFALTKIFEKKGVSVPQLLAVDESQQYYLLNDLGNETLYSFLMAHRNGAELGEDVLQYYYLVLKELPKIQCVADQMDFSFCYPRHAFDKLSMQWDLNYFKYYFLKLAGIPFDEQLLEDDFSIFINFLMQAENHYFLYRDFQSRNIMIADEKVFFIDYQGGRKGPLQYDLASLLYDGKADISPEYREKLLHFYLDEMEKQGNFNRENFLLYYDAFILIRIMQALGAYGFRGYYEKKSHFLLSIPYAIRNIKYLLKKGHFPFHTPELMKVLESIAQSKELPHFENRKDVLTIYVTSFSYKKGIPQDYSSNGGGFVFDCRALPNPGREEHYRKFTGKDKEVIDYLQKYQETASFQQNVFALIDASVDNYLERKFTHLMVNFGCTGGQHRSVYFAEQLVKHLKEKYPTTNVLLKHTNQKE